MQAYSAPPRPPLGPLIVEAVASGGLLVLAYVVGDWFRRVSGWLVLKGLLAARLDPHDTVAVLEHPTRRWIVDRLTAEGRWWKLADLRHEVARVHDVSLMMAYLHLHTLRRAGLVHVTKVGRQAYVGVGTAGCAEQKAALALLGSDAARYAAEFVHAHPGAAQKEIVAGVHARQARAGERPTPRVTLARLLKRLEGSGVVPERNLRTFREPHRGEAEPEASVALLERRAGTGDRREVHFYALPALAAALETLAGPKPVAPVKPKPLPARLPTPRSGNLAAS